MVKFHDLNLPKTKDVVAQKHSIKLALKFGYDIIAVNTVVEEGGKIPPAPPPINIDLTQEKEGKFQQLSRVTVVLGNKTDKVFMRNENIKSYDIIAVQPTTEKSLQIACCDLNIDLITFDFCQFMDYHIKHGNIQTAQKMGKYFEICYAPAIRDSSCRKHFFRNTIDFIDKKAAKNTIISSSAELPVHLRGPYDIANLALLFGMDQRQAKDSLTTVCRSLLVKASTRRQTVKSSMTVSYLKDVAEKDKWKVGGSPEKTAAHKGKRQSEEEVVPEGKKKAKKLKTK